MFFYCSTSCFIRFYAPKLTKQAYLTFINYDFVGFWSKVKNDLNSPRFLAVLKGLKVHSNCAGGFFGHRANTFIRCFSLSFCCFSSLLFATDACLFAAFCLPLLASCFLACICCCCLASPSASFPCIAGLCCSRCCCCCLLTFLLLFLLLALSLLLLWLVLLLLLLLCCCCVVVVSDVMLLLMMLLLLLTMLFLLML